MKKNTFKETLLAFWVIIGSLIILFFFLLGIGVILRAAGIIPNSENSDSEDICDIGRLSIAGDYTKDLSYFEVRQCAIKDCAAFNDYAKANDIQTRCVV